MKPACHLMTAISHDSGSIRRYHVIPPLTCHPHSLSTNYCREANFNFSDDLVVSRSFEVIFFQQVNVEKFFFITTSRRLDVQMFLISGEWTSIARQKTNDDCVDRRSEFEEVDQTRRCSDLRLPDLGRNQKIMLSSCHLHIICAKDGEASFHKR